MYYSIIIYFSLSVGAISASANLTSYPPSTLQVSQKDGLVFAFAYNGTANSIPASLECMKAPYIQRGSADGGGEQTEAQRQNENETTEKKAKELSPEDDENYELDDSGCPDLAKNFFPCEDCGGRDEHWRCKGDPEDDNRWVGCPCREPDWEANPNPPGLVRPHYREHQEALRDHHNLPDEEVSDVSRAPSPTVLVHLELPSATITVLPYFLAKG
ncbi:hypothetical protein BCR34DRAFT_127203 [Clohesyomyces aquaticus]|uniref:Uncharacterized protein n=1 Tax=Clohesyomyces aquaticus TaxID=1231657 RepID=A0A1Y2AA53_9PLEO|nr:hypothetical protein BCR34DRAFT_127203 [Clohesyomyces aquaticus]